MTEDARLWVLAQVQKGRNSGTDYFPVEHEDTFDQAYIFNLGVIAAARRMGVGKALMVAALKVCMANPHYPLSACNGSRTRSPPGALWSCENSQRPTDVDRIPCPSRSKRVAAPGNTNPGSLAARLHLIRKMRSCASVTCC